MALEKAKIKSRNNQVRFHSSNQLPIVQKSKCKQVYARIECTKKKIVILLVEIRESARDELCILQYIL